MEAKEEEQDAAKAAAAAVGQAPEAGGYDASAGYAQDNWDEQQGGQYAPVAGNWDQAPAPSGWDQQQGGDFGAGYAPQGY